MPACYRGKPSVVIARRVVYLEVVPSTPLGAPK